MVRKIVKKLKSFILLGFLMCALFALVGCRNGLDCPSNFSVDDRYTLTWTAVEDAHSYKLQVKNIESGEELTWTTRKNSYSLSRLAEGDYEIRVKSLGGGKDSDNDSDWSQAFAFHKNYETGCIYTLINNNTEYEITKVGTSSGSFTIEDVYRGKPVTRIADSAFKGSGKVVNIVVGNNVTSIGEKAFYNCSKLESVVLPSKLQSLGVSAFQSCRALKEITIPDSLKTISESAFSYCRSLEKVTLGASVETIGDSAFSDCSKLKEIVFPDSVKTIESHAFAANYTAATDTEPAYGLTSVTFGKGIQTIESHAFLKCGLLTELNFAEENSLTLIDEYAFSECVALSEVHLPEGVESLGEGAFYLCDALNEITIPDSVSQVGKQVFNATKFYKAAVDVGETYIYADNWLVGVTSSVKESVEIMDAETFKSGIVGIADSVFSYCKALKKVTLPDTVKYIGKNSFYSCPQLWQLKTYTTSNSVVSIGNRAFAYCETLSSVSLGEGLKTIGHYAFYGCKSLDNNSITGTSLIPESVTSIGTYAFNGTALWTKAKGVVYAGDWVVGYNDGADMSTVTLKDGVRGVADYAFYQCEALRTIRGLHNVTYVGIGAFYECTNLSLVTLSDNLRKIEDFTFYKCTSLYNIELPLRLEEIGRSAFYKCEMLSEIDMSKCRVEKIGLKAFYNCFNIKKVDFGDDLKSIGDYAFYKCASIEEIVIPDGVTSIGNCAFYKNTAVKSLTLGNKVETIANYAFSGCSSLESITIPDSVKTVGKSAFYKCASVKTLTLGNSLETIGDYAFYEMASLKKLHIPDSVMSIGKYAFKGCNGLTSLTLKSTVKNIGAHAFYGCKSMTVYTDAESILGGWQARWNSSYRPVVWGCTLSEGNAEENEYVVSLTVTEDTLLNEKAQGGIIAPKRDGYTFVGWATESNSSRVVYTADQLSEVPEGTTLYAVWIEGEPIEETPVDSTEPEDSAALEDFVGGLEITPINVLESVTA